MHHSTKSRTSKSSSKKLRVWGQLLLHPALSTSFSTINLTEKIFTVGRFSDNSLSINEKNVGKHILKHISRRHFIMKKQMVLGLLLVHVTDLSFNGTYINGVKIGKNNTFTLFDGDCIAIGKPNYTVFTFRDLCIGRGKYKHRNLEETVCSRYSSRIDPGDGVSPMYTSRQPAKSGNFNYL